MIFVLLLEAAVHRTQQWDCVTVHNAHKTDIQMSSGALRDSLFIAYILMAASYQVITQLLNIKGFLCR